KEIFGPVLHVLTYKSQELDTLLDKINAAGYGLTFGVHSRIDEHIDALTQRIHAGNIYVNRNIVGAVVGVQPFGGEGLSGTGPKAGGPLYLYRLLRHYPPASVKAAIAYGSTEITVNASSANKITSILDTFKRWATQQNQTLIVECCEAFAALSQAEISHLLPGPT